LRDTVVERKTLGAIEKEDRDSEAELLKSVHNAYLEVAKGSLDRAIQRATYVTTAASAIGTVYASLLALLFSTDVKSGGTPIKPDALIPAAFLGLSIVFSTAYMAFLQSRSRRRDLLPTGIGGDVAQIRLLTFLEWTFSGVVERAWTLRFAVVSLGLGVLLLAVPFVSFEDWKLGPFHGSAVIAGVAVLLLLTWGIVEVTISVRRAVKGGSYVEEDDVTPNPTFG
jgi:hypothetical protein